MNRIDRLFNILLLLQARRRLRAQDLAAQFGVSERTVYRDIAALLEMGVPVVSLPGEGYELMPGYYLPPLIFTPEEARALCLGATLLETSGNYPGAAAQARDKILTSLPRCTRAEVERLTDILSLVMEPGQFDLGTPYLVALQDAIHARRVVRIRYHGLSRQPSIRDVEPLRLRWLVYERAWYFTGYCRLRQGLRIFRLERIEVLDVLLEHFAPRELEEQDEPPPDITVRVRFPADFARWVRERQHYMFVSESDAADDVIMTYCVNRIDQIVPWLLSWGAQALVIEPETVREALRSEAGRLLDILT